MNAQQRLTLDLLKAIGIPDDVKTQGFTIHCSREGMLVQVNVVLMDRLPAPEKCVLSEVRDLLGEQSQ